MRGSSKLLKNTAVLTVGRTSGYVLSFVRNLLLARVLAKADYGLAAVFGMAMTLLEISGRMGLGTQLIQSKEGATPEFQASAHAVQFVGGLCSAILIASMSVPMAHAFSVPHAAWAFASLALVPLFHGIGHLDISRRQRELDFVPLILVDVVPQFIITAAAWPLALWLGDYRVIVWLLIAKAVTGTAISFMCADRPYRWAWKGENIRRLLSFGWPLLLTGLVMFGSQQGDQMLVGSVFSLNVLANYALAFSLVSIPWFIFSQVAGPLMLPLLSQAQDDPIRFRRNYRISAQLAAVCGALSLLPLIMSGEQVVSLLFGAKYHGTGSFVALLGSAFALRFLRFAPAVASSARGDTINHLYSNLWRASSLPIAVAVAAIGGSPTQIAACAIVGEVLATIAAALRLSRQGVPLRESYGASLYLMTLLTMGSVITFLMGDTLGIWSAAMLAVAALMSALVMARLMFPEIVGYLTESVRKRPPVIAVTAN